MRNLAKFICLALVAFTVLGTVACAPAKEKEFEDYPDAAPDEYIEKHDDVSSELYNSLLADYKAAYEPARNEKNISKRFALMAIAEAKLMEGAYMLPLSSRGGNYAISRVAPHTTADVLWGNDQDRVSRSIIATELIKKVDSDAMKTKWAELKGTGTYLDWVKTYLTDHGYKISTVYNELYSSDPKTWDTFVTSRQPDAECINHTYDGLVEYDVEGIIQPALAESWKVSDDGLTYTFNLRKGVKWVDSQGKYICDVTAKDFVAGFQHLMDNEGGPLYIIQPLVVGADDYIKGSRDISKVGIKAVDDHTLEYKLVKPASYFLTMLGYSVFAPLCKNFYESQGGKFGADFKSDDPDYKYGKSKDSIAYCGPYLCVEHTPENKMKYVLNESYWNKDKVNVTEINRFFTDGKDTLRGYNDAKAGKINGAGLNASSFEVAKKDKMDDYMYVTKNDATTFSCFFNINRHQFKNVADGHAVSLKPAAERGRTVEVLKNVHFRRAFNFSIDRIIYNAQTVGDNVAVLSLRNCYTPGNFVALDADTTVKIGGKDKTYPKGTYYGEIMQDQIDADGVKIKVWDPEGNNGAGSSDGFDGWYNVDNARAELKKAIKELKKDGVVLTKEHPVHLDLPCFWGSDTYKNRGQALKKSVEEALEGYVVVDLVECPTSADWYNAGFFTEKGYEANYDLYDVSGWGPDYGDPSTYLDTFLADYEGYMSKCIGLF